MALLHPCVSFASVSRSIASGHFVRPLQLAVLACIERGKRISYKKLRSLVARVASRPNSQNLPMSIATWRPHTVAEGASALSHETRWFGLEG